MKKIIIIFIVIFSCYIKVNAKEIVIDGIIYNADEKIEGDSFLYDNTNNTLNLDNYYGNYINYDDDLIINLNGNCIINSSSENVGIRATNLIIKGNGNLYIINTKLGISTNNLEVENIILYISNSEFGINVKNNLIINQSKLVINVNNIGIENNEKINITDSLINIYGNKGIVSNRESIMFFNKVNMLIKTTNSALYNFKEINLNDSTLKLKCNLSSSIYGGNVKYVGNYQVKTSNDDIEYYDFNNYQESTYYYNYLYLIISKSDISELLVDDRSLVYEIDDSILDRNNHLNMENENTNNSNDNIIDNPNTSDNIWLYINIFVTSVLILGIYLLGNKYYVKN